jgi:hypothetical protein
MAASIAAGNPSGPEPMLYRDGKKTVANANG